MVKNLCIIPARGGSKRIPKKNIKDFLGKPIIAYSIEAAFSSGLFDEVMVSTDSKEITEIARQFGAKVPFLRSKEKSDDYSVLADVILEVLDAYDKGGRCFDHICCILPTAPFVTQDRLQEGYELLLKNDYDTVIPVLAFSFPIQRALRMERGKVAMVSEEHINSRSQDLEKRYHDSGQFYWIHTNRFKINKKLFAQNSGGLEIPEIEAQDIDTLTDWKIAEIKYNIHHHDQKNTL